MPLHDLGYRNWDGRLAPSSTRWFVIAETGIRMAWKSSWLRRMLFFAWLPASYLGIGFFLYERSMQFPNARQVVANMMQAFPQDQEITEKISEALGINVHTATEEQLEEARHQIWAWLLHALFRYPQIYLMVMVVGLIAPALIAQDVRSRAFLLYFSRPLTRSEYILGKAAIVWCYLIIITTLPALALYVLGVLLSPELSVITYTWDLPLRIVAASAVLIIPTTAWALCFSSLTTESRYAGFAWFAVWILGWVTYAILAAFEIRNPGEESQWKLVSLYHVLGDVQNWVFGFKDSFSDILYSALLLTVLTVIALVVLFRRVSSPMRI